ncbi:HAD family hydrolase [Streptomyces lavendofoliae]|uniref:HAD family hydrolase n=1 Tax=Streptomyces lavendofoliae TaxID=67314 RepID=UPI003D8C2AD5
MLRRDPVSNPPQQAAPPDVHLVTTGAAFFDLDRTVIARSSTLALAPVFYRAGLIHRSVFIRAALGQLRFHTAGEGQREARSLLLELQKIGAGWAVGQVTELVRASLPTVLYPLVYRQAQDLLQRHREAGRPLVLVTASSQVVAEPMAAVLGIEHVIATRPEVRRGRYTGAVESYPYAQGKATAMRALAASHGWNLERSYAYSDSYTDMPMLLTVGHPCAVNPDRRLRRHAVSAGWPILVAKEKVGKLPAGVGPPAGPGDPDFGAIP